MCSFLETEQASPDSLESADRNGELENGTGEEHPESAEDRRPSLNASTPDDDLSFRERTSTVPVSPVRAIAQVYINQSTAAQSEPDLLGVPYTTHENVLLRKRAVNNALSISPEFTNEILNSRLSMPPFVFSSTSLRSFENSPSTSSSFANDMALRADGNEEDTARENSSCHDETGDSSLNEPVNRNLNDEMEATSNSMETSTRNSCNNPSGTMTDTSLSITGLVQPSREAENCQSFSSIANSELEDINAGGESDANDQGTSLNSETMMNVVNSDGTSDLQDVGVNNVGLDNCYENSHAVTNQREANAETRVNEAVLQVHEPVANVEVPNNENINEVSDTEEACTEVTLDNTNTNLQDSTIEFVLPSPLESSLSEDNSSPAQQVSSVSVDSVPSRENSLLLTAQPSLQNEVLTVDLPTEGPGDSLQNRDFTMLRELPGPVNSGEEGTNSGTLQENNNRETNSANQPDSLTVNNPSTLSVAVNGGLSASSTPSNEYTSTPNTGQVEVPDENQVSQNSVQRNDSILTRFVGDLNRNLFMDLESEPEIMNVLSLSNAATSDIIMPTQSTDIEETSPRRTMGTCNLRTLFQIPDSESNSMVGTDTRNSSLERIQQDSTSEEVDAEISVSENSDALPEVSSNLSNHDNSASNDNSDYVSTVDLNTHGSSNTSDVWQRNTALIVENSTSSDVLSRGVNNELHRMQLLENTLVNGQHGAEQTSTEDVLSQSPRSENSDSATTVNVTVVPQSLSNDESTSQRPTVPSPVPSITHVRYLRSKNLSIRLPSRSATPLPVVHVVPPNVPVSSAVHGDDLLSSSIEADPVLPATRLDSPVLFNREARAGISLARDVFDAPDGSREAVNDGASTSSSGAFFSEATAEVRRSSGSAVTHSAPKHRRSSESSQSGDAKNKKKNKLRNKTSRHSSSIERMEGPEQFSGQPQSRSRTREETTNRSLHNTMEEGNDESSSSHRPASIYGQISDFPSDEDALDEPLPPRKYTQVFFMKSLYLCYLSQNDGKMLEQSLNKHEHVKLIYDQHIHRVSLLWFC